MQRRLSPLGAGRPRPLDSILLYGFGLALALSLMFNGFLLYKQSHQRTIYEFDLGSSPQLSDDMGGLEQRSDCKPGNPPKDRFIGSSTDSSDEAASRRAP